ncbi:ABC transporter ATP-binding protein [Lentilactobacillus kribbianus]|uniref:ATP-binding cassette domain-containing protein n=1 Tax=Lentilactobacillus kribbianus TaxID=2729622 RepID=UPI00155735F4|nr:ABC transporter ATP-binding protein [Lentilactobacillus kribbianus]
MSVLDINHVGKKFGDKVVLRDINLRLSENKIYGVLGRNGAGKSTLLNIMTNRIFPSNGKITIDGEPVDNNDAQLSKMYLMSEINLYRDSDRLSKIIDDTEMLYGNIDRELVNDLATKFNLDLAQKFGKLSTGYRSIFKLIIAMSLPVEYVLLDEPVLGLDANHRELFYSVLLESFSQRPRTFVISTHLIEEITNIISDVIVINQGEVVLNDSVENVTAKAVAVVGPTSAVDQYIMGLHVIGHENIGQLKASYVFDELPDDRQIPDTVTITPLDLQKLFINLTDYTGGAKDEN